MNINEKITCVEFVVRTKLFGDGYSSEAVLRNGKLNFE